MTIEIRQLVIRAIAEARPEAGPQQPATPGVAPVATPRQVAPTQSPSERRALVAACVREVLRELKKSRER